MVHSHATDVQRPAPLQAGRGVADPARTSGRTDASATERKRLRDARRAVAGGSRKPAPLSDVRWLAVESTSIDAVGYRAGKLYVRFKGGGSEYEYDSVPWNIYCGLTGAARARDGSVGRFFNLQVRPVYTTFRKIR